MSESQGQRIGRTKSLPDAIALVRAQRLLQISVIRVNSDAVSGHIVIEQQKTIIDAVMDNDDAEAQQALIALLSVSAAEYDVIKLENAKSDDFRHALHVNLKTIGREVATSAERRALIDADLTESRDFLQDVKRERPIVGWGRYRSIKDSLVDTSVKLMSRKSHERSVAFQLLMIVLAPICIVAYFVMSQKHPEPIKQLQPAVHTEAVLQATAVAPDVSPPVTQTVKTSTTTAEATTASVGNSTMDDKELNKLDLQMKKAERLESNGNIDDAMTEYADIIVRYPKYTQPRIRIIKAFVLKHDYKKAAYYCEEGIRKAKNASDYRYFSQLFAKISPLVG